MRRSGALARSVHARKRALPRGATARRRELDAAQGLRPVARDGALREHDFGDVRGEALGVARRAPGVHEVPGGREECAPRGEKALGLGLARPALDLGDAREDARLDAGPLGVDGRAPPRGRPTGPRGLGDADGADADDAEGSSASRAWTMSSPRAGSTGSTKRISWPA